MLQTSGDIDTRDNLMSFIKYNTLEDRIASFWSKVAITADDNKCWLWLGAAGIYGYKRWNGKQERAHRIAWMLPDYVIPDGMEIMHSCDNPLCCNPKHLSVGTRKDNADDREQKGRGKQPKGEEHWNCKLTEVEAIQIRHRLANGEKRSQLAKEYGLHYNTVKEISQGKLWAYLDGSIQSGNLSPDERKTDEQGNHTGRVHNPPKTAS